MAVADISGSVHDVLHEEVSRTRTDHVEIRPHRLIVAWHGVLTLSFEAWPKELADIKRRINEAPEFQAAYENFGTRWPKLTLAAIDDDAPPLTLDRLRSLTSLCREFDAELQQLGTVLLSHVSIVMFASRSLDRCLCRVDYPFAKEEQKEEMTRRRRSKDQEYDADSFEIVRKVVRETDDRHLEGYLAKVNADGHRWGRHYDTTWTEATIVCFLTNNDVEGGDDDVEADGSSPPRPVCQLLTLLASFQERVDAMLPGRYRWMPRKSLHLSLRSLDNRSDL